MRAACLAALTALIALLAIAPAAFGAGISLDRTPSPPQAVLRGSGVQSFSFTITYTSIPIRYVFRVVDPTGAAVITRSVPLSPSQPGPVTATESFAPSAGALVGRYRAVIEFYSSAGEIDPEASAQVNFDVAPNLGTLQLIKFEDTNGNGARDVGEPGVPGWSFRLINPLGGTSDATTGPDGTVTITGVPAGVWQVSEIMKQGWQPTTPASGTVGVPQGGLGSFTAGNVRPAPLSGTVFIDSNGNGVINPGEVGRGGVTITLGGVTGTGQTVSATTITAQDGTYQFPDLLPGVYSATMTTPTGLTATTPVTRANRVITSGVGNPNNNFGLRSTTATITQRPDISIDKRGPASATRGATFRYTIVVRNNSSFAARNVEVTDLVPANLTLVRIPSGAFIRNGVVTWRLGTLRAGQSRTLSMLVRVNPTTSATRITNTATVTADGLPPRRDSVTTRLRDRPPVRRTGAVTG
jgi:uncharacterized repeat protein (TIGR01451 family)